MTFSARGITAKAYQAITQPLKPIKCLCLGFLLKTSPSMGSAGKLDLAAEIARTSPLFLGRHIEQLNISSEENRSTLAEMVGKIDPWVLQETLPNFQLTQGSPVVYNFVKTSFEKDPSLSYTPFRELLTEEQRISFVEQAIERNPFLTLFQIKTYFLGSEKVLNKPRSRSKQLLTKAEELSPEIQKLEEKAEQLRFIKAKQEIEQSKNIETFEIEKYRLNPESRFEIAKLILAKMENVNNFPISRYNLTEKSCFEIAKIVLERTSDVSLFPIDQYFLSQNDRYELAKMIIAKDPFISDDQIRKITPEETASYVSLESLPKFLINMAEKLRFERAKKTISENKDFISHFSLSPYRIQNKQYHKELAFCAVKKNVEYVQLMESFELEEKDRFEIAMLAAQKDGKILSENIDRFQISDEEKLFAIAMSAKSQNKEATLQNLHKYQITNEKYLKLLDDRIETEKSTDPKNSSSTSPDDLSKLSKKELLKRQEHYESRLSKIQGLGKDKGAFSGEKRSVNDPYAETEKKLHQVKEELNRRKYKFFW